MTQKKWKWVVVPVLAFSLSFSSISVAPLVSVNQQVHAASSSHQTQMNAFSKEWVSFYANLDTEIEKLLEVLFAAEEAEDASVMAETHAILTNMEKLSSDFEIKMKTKVSGMHSDIRAIHSYKVKSLKLELQIVNHLFDYFDEYVKWLAGDITDEQFEAADAQYEEIGTPIEKEYDANESRLLLRLKNYSKTYQVAYSKGMEELLDATLTVKPTISYKVKRGDTLTFIARNYGMTVAQLKSINGLKTNGLKIGQVLQVHAYKTTSTAYVVQKGDTLTSISKKYGLTVAQLKNLNKLKTNGLRIGQKLKVDWTYTVKRGDTLSAIGKKYGKSVQQLKNINLLTTNGLKVGQVLRLN